MFNFLALLDIRVFGRLYLWLLIGLALFLQPGCFCLAYIIAHVCTADLIIVSSLRAVCYRSLKVIYSETSYPGTHTYRHLKDTTERLNFVNPMNVANENRKKIKLSELKK